MEDISLKVKISFANISHLNKELSFIVFFLGINTKYIRDAYDLVMFLDLLQPGPEGEKWS